MSKDSADIHNVQFLSFLPGDKTKIPLFASLASTIII